MIPNELQKVTLPLNNFETCVGYWGNPEVNPILGKYTPRMQCCGGQGTSCLTRLSFNAVDQLVMSFYHLDFKLFVLVSY